jgi:hypothetical protein
MSPAKAAWAFISPLRLVPERWEALYLSQAALRNTPTHPEYDGRWAGRADPISHTGPSGGRMAGALEG